MTSETSAPLTIVGLGPGGAQYLTTEARRALREAGEIWLRTRKHPLGRFLARRDGVHSFDEIYEQAPSFEQVYTTIAERVLELARRPEGVVYAVPGHPLVGEESVCRLLRLAKAEGLAVRIVAGVSFLEPAFTALALDPLDEGLQIIDATMLAGRVAAPAEGGRDDRWPQLLAVEPLLPTAPALICQLYSRQLAAAVKLALLEHYPPAHAVTLVQRAGVRGQEKKAVLPLFQLDRRRAIDHLTCLYVPPLPPLEALTAFSTLRHIVARLRAPGGCPWDREQTHQSLKPYLIEECYEVLEALDSGDMAELAEELGDLLLQIVLHAQLAAEVGDFAMPDVLEHISAKLIRRHPHVFSGRTVADAAEVVRNWEQIKRAERGDEEGDKTTMLGGVPKEMPALAHASSIQRRVADLGFDWDDAAGALAKVAEEARELEQAGDIDARRAEFGDLLFALVSAGRHLGLDAEESLRLANRRFMQRFARLEYLVRRRGVALRDITADEIERLWRAAKVGGGA